MYDSITAAVDFTTVVAAVGLVAAAVAGFYMFRAGAVIALNTIKGVR